MPALDDGGLRPSTGEPLERLGNEGFAVVSDRRAVSDHDILGRPGNDLPQGFTRCVAVGECYAKFAGHRGLATRHQIQPSDQRPPAAKPSGRELLQQVREQHRAATPVEEDGFCRNPIAAHQDIIDFV